MLGQECLMLDEGLMLDKGNLKGGSVDELRAMLEKKSGKTTEKVK